MFVTFLTFALYSCFFIGIGIGIIVFLVIVSAYINKIVWNLAVLPILGALYFFTKNKYSDDEPLVVYKRAYLVHDGASKKAFIAPMRSIGIKIKAIDNAFCDRKGRHTQIPKGKCSCGFYGMRYKWLVFCNPTTAHPFYIARKHENIDLRVEFYGKIIEHVAGYRAQHQRILRVILPKRCAKKYCVRKTTNMVRAIDMGIDTFASDRMLYPVCTRHCTDKQGDMFEPCISTLELANQLGTEVVLR